MENFAQLWLGWVGINLISKVKIMCNCLNLIVRLLLSCTVFVRYMSLFVGSANCQTNKICM